MSISILIADDQKIICESLKTLLETQVDFIILGEANNGIQAIDQCRDLQPDILILDISMPEMSGLEAIPYIRQVAPQSKIIIFSNHAHQSYVEKALKDGAMGYVRKQPDDSAKIIQAIRRVMSDEKYISNEKSTFE